MTEATEVTEEIAKLEQINEVLANLDDVLKQLCESNCTDLINELGDPMQATDYLARVELMDENMDRVNHAFKKFKEKSYDNLDPLTELM